MPLPAQNPHRQLFYFEGALARHLEALSCSRGLMPLRRADTFETVSLTDASISFTRTRYGSELFAGLNLIFEPPGGCVQGSNVMRAPFESSYH